MYKAIEPSRIGPSPELPVSPPEGASRDAATTDTKQPGGVFDRKFGKFDRKAYQREYMRKRRASKGH